MNMQQGNLFSNRHNSLLTRSRNISHMFINESLKSIDEEELCFINYMKANSCDEYILLSRYISFINNNDFSFLDNEFDNSDFSTGVESKNNRIKDLIYKTSSIMITNNDLINLVKYKNKRKKGLQLFIIYDNTCNAGRIYLIDLYHMVIPTEQRLANGKVVPSNPKRLYEGMKKNVKNNVDLCTLRTLVH